MRKNETLANHFPLTSAQEAILAGHLIDVNNYRFNAAFYFAVPEEINTKYLLASAKQLAQEATLQRVKLISKDSQWTQCIEIAPESVTTLITFQAAACAIQWMNNELQIPMLLSSGDPLYKQWLINTEDGKTFFFVKYHHFVLDGFGQSLLLKRLHEIYRELSKENPISDQVWTTDEDYFVSATKKQDIDKESSIFSKISRDYHDVDEVTTLGASRSNFAQGLLQARQTLGIDILDQVRNQARNENVPESVLLTAIIASYFYLATGKEKIVLGFPVSARTNRSLLNKPSMQSNEWPLLFDFSVLKEASGAINKILLIQRAKQEVANALSSQGIRSEAVHRHLNRTGWDEKLTKTLVNILPFGVDLELGGIQIPIHQLATGPVNDLNINIFIKSTHIDILWDANPENYTQQQLDRHAERFFNYVKNSFLLSPLSVSSNSIYLESDKYAVNRLFGEKKNWSLDVSLCALIDQQARSLPEAIAIECLEYQLTYNELKKQSDFLALSLLEKGIQYGSAIGIYGKRSSLMVVAILAIQKAGCAYVPLGPDLPIARLEAQTQQANIQLILHWDQAPSLHIEAIKIEREDTAKGGITGGGVKGSLPALKPELTAYIIFTSGSTGAPKGVAVSHSAIANRILWMQSEYKLLKSDCVLQKTPFTFDVSLWEFFWPLSVGARLVMAPPEAHKDPRELLNVINRYGITTLHFVPPMLDHFLQEIRVPHTPIKRIFCSGEALKPRTVEETFRRLPQVELHNLYGPTEAAVDVSYWPCSLDDARRTTIPIGWPVANTQLWVLNSSLCPALPGIPGELYIGGPQVALGYVNQPNLTAERFINIDGIAGTLYRTGDLVVLTEENGLDFLGRLDHQVKIRGLRIELQEIESKLLSLSQVKQAVVKVFNNPNPRLVAYVVMTDSNALADVRTYIAQQLPEYMVPSQWQMLDELPLTLSGKVDRRALAEPEQDTQYTESESQAEALLQGVWQKVLGLNEIGTETPFFALGGDSMMAIRVRMEIEQQGWTFNLAQLFRNPTIRQLASQLVSHQLAVNLVRKPFQELSDEDRARLPEQLEDAFPMSAMQESMMYQAEIDQKSSVYRVVTSLTVELPLAPDHMETALQYVLQRHPLLRSSFDLSSFSHPLVLIHKSIDTPIIYEKSLSHLNTVEQQTFIRTWVEEAKFQTFDLSLAPGLRFYTHSLGEQRFQFSVVEHHVVLDGWSDLLMLDEIVDCYSGLLLGDVVPSPTLLSHYADFVAAENALVSNETAREYWQAVTAAVDSSPLPRQESAGATHHRSYHANIPAELNDALLAVAQAQNCSIKSLLIAAHLTVLGAITGNVQVASGSVFNGRLDRPDGDKVIGVFLNTLPLSLSLENRNFVELAQAVAEFEYQSYPFGRYPYTIMQRESRHELNLDNYVNYMDFHRQWGEGSTVSHAFGVANTNFSLAVNYLVDPVSQSLSLWFDCDIGSLDAALCERLPEYYLSVLYQISNDPYCAVLETDIITPKELKLLERWNQTAVVYDGVNLVHQQFEHHAEQYPHRAALSYLSQTLTYRELNHLANQIAHALIDAGIEANHIVGVCVPRCPELVASLLAIHKVGATFLPLDPKYPLDRLNYIAQDSELKALLTHSISPHLNADIRIFVDKGLQHQQTENIQRSVDPASNAYCIYTSGSTGLPKGAVISHRNLLNFLVGMDKAIGCEPSDTLLALTSASFDISILELFWPLTKGAKVVLGGENQIHNLSEQPAERATNTLDFSLFFFGAASGMADRQESYQLVLDAACFADQNDFKAVWTPERHFHEFGGLYPNPAVLSAALATITHRIELRSGSVVAPLHDALRLAEEWALVDNLSKGRVGLAFASGWNSNDFALAPEHYNNRKAVMLEKLQQLRILWSGGHIPRVNGDGHLIDLSIYPQPVRSELPIWLTSAGAASTFEMAGTYGLNVLTHLLGQDIQELTDKISIYRAAWKAAGHSGEGHVSLMVHTFLLANEQEAKHIAKEPFREYLRTSAGLLRQLTASMGVDFPEAMDSDDMESILDLAVDRYFEHSGLFGSPDSVAPLLQKLQNAGVDEIASLIDFGISNENTLRGLDSINQLRLQHLREQQLARYSCERLIREHQVTMLQSTPSFMTAAMSEVGLVDALEGLNTLMVGGEAFPAGLAIQLQERLKTRVFNMYGPTETTIWSSVHRLTPSSIVNNRIPIGSPIANTQMKVLNAAKRQVPIGVSGELWIGGDGVCSGYWNRKELTAERFQTLDDGQIYYRTGDRVCWQANGELLFLGRVDRQVKLRGHRIELDEVEGVLSQHDAVRSGVVVIHETGQGVMELVAYVEADTQSLNSEETHHRVQHWGELWNSAYRNGQAVSTPNSRAGDFAGWLSSYTGEPIPVADMEEWLDHTLRKVEAYHLHKVVDVGVGMGLYLRRLIHQCEHYTGIDLSEEALRVSNASVPPELRATKQLSLIQGDALALKQLPERHADLVLVNSVVQYFPSSAYFTQMLFEASRVLSESGVIFLGDIRSLDELVLFHTSVQFHKASPLTTLNEINILIQQHLKMEKELCLSPGYFDQLPTLLPAIGLVEMELKRGSASNELNDFRYDVILHLQASKTLKRTEWMHEGSAMNIQALDSLVEKIKSSGVDGLLVRDIPNHRLDRPKRISSLLKELPANATKWDLAKRLWELERETSLMPEMLARHFEAEGYQVRLLIHSGQGLNRFDLELTHIKSADVFQSRFTSKHDAMEGAL